MAAELEPVSPREVLVEEFLRPHGVMDLLDGKCITPDQAQRLGLLLGTTAEFWLNLQTQFDARKP